MTERRASHNKTFDQTVGHMAIRTCPPAGQCRRYPDPAENG